MNRSILRALLVSVAAFLPEARAQDASRPALAFAITDLDRRVDELLESDALAELERGPAMQALRARLESSPLATARAGWAAIRPWVPSRIALHLPQGADASFAGVGELVLAFVQGQLDPDAAGGMPELRRRMVAGAEQLARISLAIELEWDDVRMAEQLFETWASKADPDAFRRDGDRVSGAMPAAAILARLEVEEGTELRATLDECASVVDLSLVFELDGRVMRFGLAPTGAALPEPTARVAASDEWLRARWALPRTLEQIARIATVLGAYPAEWFEGSKIDPRGFAASLDALRARSSSGELRATADATGLRFESRREAAAGDVDDLAGNGILGSVPRGTSFWFASSQADLVEASILGASELCDRLAGIPSDNSPDGGASLLAGQRALLDVIDRLGAHRGALAAGWAVVVQDAGLLGGRQGSARVPEVAVVARIADAERARAFAADALAAFGLDAELEWNETRTAAASAAVRSSPLAAPMVMLADDRLILSTSMGLTRRCLDAAEAGGDHTVTEGVVFDMVTSGRRLGDVLCIVAGLVEPRDTMIQDLCYEVPAALGAIRWTERLDGEDVVSALSIAFRSAESADDARVLERLRAAQPMSRLRDDEVLTAIGQCRFAGVEGAFEFAYAPDGDFREATETQPTLDITCDGDLLLQDEGFGANPYAPAVSGYPRSWAAFASGAWAARASGFGARVVERTAEEATLALRPPGSVTEHLARFDLATGEGIRLGASAGYPFGDVQWLDLGDFRETPVGRMPHRLTTGSDNAYTVARWAAGKAEADAPRRTASAALQPVGAGTEGLRLRRIEDWLLTEGRVGDREGWIAVSPLAFEGSVHRGVCADAPDHGTAAEIRDLQVGFLRADAITLRVSELPEVGGRQVLAWVGVQALGAACVRFDLGRIEVELLPPGAFDGSAAGDGDWLPMTLCNGMVAFQGSLASGENAWWSPITRATDSMAILKPGVRDQLWPPSREGALDREGNLRAVAIAGEVAAPRRTFVPGRASFQAMRTPVSIALSGALLDGTLEIDFPRGLYRFVAR